MNKRKICGNRRKAQELLDSAGGDLPTPESEDRKHKKQRIATSTSGFRDRLAALRELPDPAPAWAQELLSQIKSLLTGLAEDKGTSAPPSVDPVRYANGLKPHVGKIIKQIFLQAEFDNVASLNKYFCKRAARKELYVKPAIERLGSAHKFCKQTQSLLESYCGEFLTKQLFGPVRKAIRTAYLHASATKKKVRAGGYSTDGNALITADRKGEIKDDDNVKKNYGESF